jgi:Na+-driven multidrug efflux pump
MQLNKVVTRIDMVSFYIINICSGTYLSYYMEVGLLGIWIGWLIGLVVSIILMSSVLLRINYNSQSDSMLE